MCQSLFVQSLVNHQQLLNILIQHKDETGVSNVSLQELANSMNRSLSWVNKAIKQINMEDVCIEKIAKNQYTVHYDNLSTRGMFYIISKMLLHTINDITLIHQSDQQLMQRFHCTLKTVQMYRAYCTSGWNQTED